MQSMGIFGGTFDPPHLGHLILAAEARTQLGLERLLWVLTPDPPHKQGQSITPLAERLEMVRLAIANDPQFEISSVEMNRPGPQYAQDTISLLAAEYPRMKLVYLMGGDSLRTLPTWHRPADFVSACSLIGVMRRPGDTIELATLEESLPGLSAKVRFVEAPLLDIAAREIRARIAEGRPFRYFLPEKVYEFIESHGLYRQ
jgi:nicotinate-nucleotide adenylyltransferase